MSLNKPKRRISCPSIVIDSTQLFRRSSSTEKGNGDNNSTCAESDKSGDSDVGGGNSTSSTRRSFMLLKSNSSRRLNVRNPFGKKSKKKISDSSKSEDFLLKLEDMESSNTSMSFSSFDSSSSSLSSWTEDGSVDKQVRFARRRKNKTVEIESCFYMSMEERRELWYDSDELSDMIHEAKHAAKQLKHMEAKISKSLENALNNARFLSATVDEDGMLECLSNEEILEKNCVDLDTINRLEHGQDDNSNVNDNITMSLRGIEKKLSTTHHFQRDEDMKEARTMVLETSMRIQNLGRSSSDNQRSHPAVEDVATQTRRESMLASLCQQYSEMVRPAVLFARLMGKADELEAKRLESIGV